jgi:hypothetical protein
MESHISLLYLIIWQRALNVQKTIEQKQKQEERLKEIKALEYRIENLEQSKTKDRALRNTLHFHDYEGSEEAQWVSGRPPGTFSAMP